MMDGRLSACWPYNGALHTAILLLTATHGPSDKEKGL